MSYDYWSQSSQAERKEILANDRDTLHSRAAAQAELEAQGRFKRENETKIVGAGVPSYPAIPSGPWSGSNPVPPGDAIDKLGYDINEVEPILDEPTPPDPETALHLPVSDTAAVSLAQADVAAEGKDRSHHSPAILPQPFHRKPWRRL